MNDILTPAKQLAEATRTRFPNESPEYRAARTALLAEEIELRRHLERVAAQRRALPPGGAVDGDYRFIGADGPGDFASLFGDKNTLVVYSFMFGPQRERACPMCTNTLGSLDATARDLDQHMALVVVARSPLERLQTFAATRGWHGLQLYQDTNENYSRDYFALLPDGNEDGVLNVFSRRDGVIRHFWAGEMTAASADPGQDPRGAPDLQPLWNIFNMTPDGRGTNWYPKLSYD